MYFTTLPTGQTDIVKADWDLWNASGYSLVVASTFSTMLSRIKYVLGLYPPVGGAALLTKMTRGVSYGNIRAELLSVLYTENALNGYAESAAMMLTLAESAGTFEQDAEILNLNLAVLR